jgi:hypothetical protein
MAGVTPDPDPQDPGEYCRLVEAYLCRKNGGHLVRIAGPSFERVCGWAAQGIPLTVVFRGIDRYVERASAKGPRRRPVLVDFCEADVLDVFDEWRRAVGVTVPAGGDAADGDAGRRPRRSLSAHFERVIVRLTTARAGGRLAPDVEAAAAAAVRELDLARATAAQVRGEARAAVVSRLRDLDAELMAAAERALTGDERTALERDARDELASFRSGMAPDAYARAVDAGARRLLRARLAFPVIAYEDA